MTTKFWGKASKCKHENLTDYAWPIYCSTAFCGGLETHCKDCGVFISHCPCGFNNGLDGWSLERRRNHDQKRI